MSEIERKGTRYEWCHEGRLLLSATFAPSHLAWYLTIECEMPWEPHVQNILFPEKEILRLGDALAEAAVEYLADKNLVVNKTIEKARDIWTTAEHGL